jgi:hypothetical protein
MNQFTNVRVQVGPPKPPQAVQFNNGPLITGATQLKQLTDLVFAGAIDGDAIVYNAASNTFSISAITNIDNGTF